MPEHSLCVAVLMGGRASEHDISLKTGTVITNNLDRIRYRVLPIQIRRDGGWLIPDAPLTGSDSWMPADETTPPVPEHTTVPAEELLRRGIDVVIVALHGRFGEDGSIQGLLDILGIPYTGSGVLGSALAMDKIRAKSLVSFAGILTPKWTVVEEADWQRRSDQIVADIGRDFGFPCVAKVPEEGSSFGMGIPQTAEELRAVIDAYVAARGHMLVEEYIKGVEITGSVLGAEPGGEPTALPLTEIVPKTSKFFDFEAKYTKGASDEITPARLDDALTIRAKQIAVTAHRVLDCGTLSRTDMIVRDCDIYYLETNTIPGMTETSLFPQAAAAAGISFPELLDRQIVLALARRQ